MPISIPSALAPYLQLSLQDGTTTLITSVLDASANWLVLRFIQSSLFGTGDDTNINRTALNGDTQITSGLPVVLLSFVRDYDFWTETGKKIGLDVGALLNKKQLAYVDGLSIGLNIPQPAAKVIKLKSHSLIDIKHGITAALSALSQNTMPGSKPTLIIDGLDFVLASQPDITGTSLNAFITGIQSDCRSVVLTASADSPLLHNIEASATPLELEHSIFVRMIAHQSTLVLQLRPLETGHAKDVSGVIRISRGGSETAEDEKLVDCEWLYQVKGDGNVRVWSRGEA